MVLLSLLITCFCDVTLCCVSDPASASDLDVVVVLTTENGATTSEVMTSAEVLALFTDVTFDDDVALTANVLLEDVASL